MQREVDLKSMSDLELKAVGYDQVKVLQVTQANLAAIEQELKSRANRAVAVEGGEPESKQG